MQRIHTYSVMGSRHDDVYEHGDAMGSRAHRGMRIDATRRTASMQRAPHRRRSPASLRVEPLPRRTVLH